MTCSAAARIRRQVDLGDLYDTAIAAVRGRQ
jgi:hypothetical protein